MTTPRRLVFGEVAELYDARRPSYPSSLIDDLIGLAGLHDGRRALEVGAGTGKATMLFAARGVSVLAVEPSAAMAAVARRNCAAFAEVEIVETDFERWDPDGETFGLLYSAQAWHWIDPELRFQRARAVLAPGGLLTAFWNRPAWGRSKLRDALAEAYRMTVPDLAPDGPMHPANRSPDADEDWPRDVAGAGGFDEATVRFYEWSVDYEADAYTGLLDTLSEIRLLEAPSRRALLTAVHTAIDDHGGTLTMPLVTRVCLARAA
jgi:SAM-dependent methyltransferase